jgi:tetratricopeptide (TPR) repeat protein
MPTSNILRLDDYRDKREQRVRLAASMHGADIGRAALLRHLADLASLVGADRAAAVWVDEYGPGLVHPHVLLDLFSDRPRRAFCIEPLHRAWETGVPGVVESPGGGGRPPEGAQWTLAVSLGSDGYRGWFLVADAVTPRPVLQTDVRDRVMFISGECSAILLHRDLDSGDESVSGERGATRAKFAGWPILQDIDGREADDAASQRIALRFVVGRLPRLLVDDGLATPADRQRQQADRAREEVDKQADAEDGETPLWYRVLDAYGAADLEALGTALLDLGAAVEGQNHLNGAAELYQTAYEVAVGSGDTGIAIDAARFAGRVLRRHAAWDDAHRWYGVARAIAEAAGLDDRVAVVLDGVANIHRDRGNHPAARAALMEAKVFAKRSGDARAIASVDHGLLSLEQVAGNLDLALVHGWNAVRAYPGERDRIEALASLGGVLVYAGEYRAAEDAWACVEHLAGDDDYIRLYAVDALGHLAARRGAAAEFARRAAAADRMGWESGPAPAKAEILYYRGMSYQCLGKVDEARRWLKRAVAFCHEHKFSRTLFRAEEALCSLDVGPTEAPAQPRGAPAAAPREVCLGLEEMRRELVGSGR